MSAIPRPVPGVEYAAAVTPEFVEARSFEAARSLAKAWQLTETRAAALLADPAEYAAEFRSRQTPAALLRRRWQPGYPDPF